MNSTTEVQAAGQQNQLQEAANVNSEAGSSNRFFQRSGFGDYIKLITAVGVILIPLLTIYIEYKQSIERNQETIFRGIVKDLSSIERQNRVTGATNLGAYVSEENKYHDTAIDILINFVALETDSDVLDAIGWSLQKVAPKYHKSVLYKLLKVNRSMFLNEYVTGQRVALAKKSFEIGIEEVSKVVRKPVYSTSSPDGVALSEMNLEKIWKEKIVLDELNHIYKLRKINLNMEERRMLTANFIASYLTVIQPLPKNIEFLQSSLNYILLNNIDLSEASIINSAFSLSVLKKINFSGSKITNSVFTDSSLEGSDFSGSIFSETLFDFVVLKLVDFKNSSFSDVFFLYADLDKADFTGAKGLKPVYFYRARNKDRAIFDSAFREELNNTVITDADFISYVTKSKITDARFSGLMKSLKLSDSYYVKDDIPKDNMELIKNLLDKTKAKADEMQK